MGTDISNAYIESYTGDPLVFTAGPEFGELEGHTMVVVKALYGIPGSGKQWAERFAAILRAEGWVPCRADHDVWMKRNGDVYEYLGTYVDDLIIAAKNPNELFDTMVNKYKLQLKGTEELRYHLGADYSRDEDGTLCQSARGYVERMADNFERLFGHRPRDYKSPLEPNDHPELDLTPELDEDDTQIYQSLIGSLQWTISLGRIDLATAVMTMSGFRSF